jgi:hypothetical protein
MVAFSPDGKTLAARSRRGAVLIDNMATEQPVRTLGLAQDGYAAAVTFSSR